MTNETMRSPLYSQLTTGSGQSIIGRQSMVKEFDWSRQDYSINYDKPLGKGQWSIVWGAEATSPSGSSSLPTPPTTPVRKTFENPTKVCKNDLAIKIPASGGSATYAIFAEAKFLSMLSVHRDLRDYIVPFHGLDRRNGAIVMQAVPLPLADAPRSYRNQYVESSVEAFLHLTVHLLEGLARLHEVGVVHADIKPSNILVDCKTGLPKPLYADFSASFIREAMPSSVRSASTGGGTWEFLAPELCSSISHERVPTSASDVYALAVSLLYFITDKSPYAGAPNAYLKRDMIRKGRPLEYAMQDAHAKKTFDRVAKKLEDRFDLIEFFELALKRNPQERLSARKWLEWLTARVY
jgi:serine/threonine protein kinase